MPCGAYHVFCLIFLTIKYVCKSERDLQFHPLQESERIQASAQSKEEMLRRLRDLVDFETREAADLQVGKTHAWGGM